MTIQEEIREGIADILRRYGNFVDGYDADGDELDIDEALEAIFTYLHSQGVVIKVDRELPFNPHIIPFIDPATMERLDSPYHLPYKHAQLDMLKAGYVAVEPLIKDDR